MNTRTLQHTTFSSPQDRLRAGYRARRERSDLDAARGIAAAVLIASSLIWAVVGVAYWLS